MLFAHLRREWLSAAWRCYTPEPATHCEGTCAGRPPAAKTAVQYSHVATWNSAAESLWHPVNHIANPLGHRTADTAESRTGIPQRRPQHRQRRNRRANEVPNQPIDEPPSPPERPDSLRSRAAETAGPKSQSRRNAGQPTNEPTNRMLPEPRIPTTMDRRTIPNIGSNLVHPREAERRGLAGMVLTAIA